jgi:hypothetical protein
MLEKMLNLKHENLIEEAAHKILHFMAGERPALSSGKWAEALEMSEWLNLGYSASTIMGSLDFLAGNKFLLEKTLDDKAFIRLSEAALNFLNGGTERLMRAS